MAKSRVPLDAIGPFLQGVRIVEDPIDGEALIEARAELDEYAWLHTESSRRSVRILERYLDPAARPRVLELGGAPYFFSALTIAGFDADLTAVNVTAGAWPGEPQEHPGGTVRLAVPNVGLGGPTGEDLPALDIPTPDNFGHESDRAVNTDTYDHAPDGSASATLQVPVDVFNMERDPFPYPDDTFDAVLCMEVLEHLGYSPSHMLAEAHRVLKPDGVFLLTVPNFINLKRTVNMILNRPTEFPYSGYGIYGRHPREFAPYEVRGLFEACNYDVEVLETANVWPTFRDSAVVGIGNAVLNAVSRLPIPWLEAKREYILCAARPVGDPVVAYPAWLYDHREMYPDPPNGIMKVLID